ncbi:hypothetical protein ACF3NA_02695 [Alkanindiges sp. WGS2144]|uniref:hypothetical protein n=1 Tax=Alkanindiges sp. WGS2144 TaxID=3366808 RepID=UPI003753AB9A
MKKTAFSLALFGTALLIGCQSSPSQPNEDSHQPLWVAKDLDLKQCEQASGNDALNKTQQSLDQSQIQVLGAHCVDDGMMRTQMCGASQGKLGIYKIAAFQLEKAQSLGFKQVQEDQYKPVACS